MNNLYIFLIINHLFGNKLNFNSETQLNISNYSVYFEKVKEINNLLKNSTNL